jgi:uncharacterized protein
LNKIVWLEWGQEAFDKARSSKRPILLDITGSWCHWCHVMDETSYSDPSVVNTVNKSFVPIRVDTDKRPDINRRYNLGGWPTTAFLDDEGKVITGGTYIPPQQMKEVLRSVLDFYTTNKGKVRSKLQAPHLHPAKDQPLSEKITSDVSTTIAVNFDMDYGGFGFEPKFPHADALEYALLRYLYHGEKEMLTIVTKTLDKMAEGGIYDHVEGGFFRYSTTRDWSIPHFEKMAEDNAKLLGVYLHAFKLTGRQLYHKVAEGIVNYVSKTLSDSTQGGFYGSQDADEEYYKLDLQKRKDQRTPAVDNTLYTNYNAMMSSSFLSASIILGKPDLGKYALKTLGRIVQLARKGVTPFHYWREGEGPMVDGLLTDYSAMVSSLLDAYEFSDDDQYLQKAVGFADDCIERLYDKSQGGFSDAPRSDSNLGELRTPDKPIDENSSIAIGLLRLSWLTEQDSYATVANKTLDRFNQDYERYGLAAGVYALAVDLSINGPVGITIVAPHDTAEFSSFKANALDVYSLRRYIHYLDPDRDAHKIAIQGYNSNSGKPMAYVCVGKTCGPPLLDPSEIDASISSLMAPRLPAS